MKAVLFSFSSKRFSSTFSAYNIGFANAFISKYVNFSKKRACLTRMIIDFEVCTFLFSAKEAYKIVALTFRNVDSIACSDDRRSIAGPFCTRISGYVSSNDLTSVSAATTRRRRRRRFFVACISHTSTVKDVSHLVHDTALDDGAHLTDGRRGRRGGGAPSTSGLGLTGSGGWGCRFGFISVKLVGEIGLF